MSACGSHLLLSSLVLFRGVNDVCRMATYCEGQLLAGLRLVTDARGLALPGWCGAFVNRFAVILDLSDRFFQNWFPPANLRHDGINCLTILRHPTISDVVPIPARDRMGCIKIRKADLGQVASETVHEQPSAEFPMPADCRTGVLWQIVVETISTPHGELPFRDVVRSANRVILDPSVHV